MKTRFFGKKAVFADGFETKPFAEKDGLVEGKISEGEEEFFKLIFWFAPQFWQNSAPFLTSVPHLEQNISIPSQKNIHIFLFLFYHRSFYLSIKTKIKTLFTKKLRAANATL